MYSERSPICLWAERAFICNLLQMIRSAASLMLTMSVVRAKKWISYLGTRRLWPVLAMRGFVGAASMTLYYEAIDRMPLADAVGICIN